MGHSTDVYGIISNLVGPDKDLVWAENMKVINSLPDEDLDYPWISHKMFSKEFQPGWETRHIHFAANYKGLEFELESWVNKFEDLLSKLMWLSAEAQIQTDISGEFEISWVAHKEMLDKWPEEKWIPTTKWESEGLVKKR